jgi:enoyl-[acyl-carrier protein] reductase I
MGMNTGILSGKKGLILGVANEHSIAWGCAKACHEAGAELALTWQSDKARPHVEPLAHALGAALAMPLNVADPAQMQALFDAITVTWGQLDFVLHSIAFAPGVDLQGRVTDSSAAGFATAMDVSCHSLVRIAKLAEPLMRSGGSLITMSYLGADEVVANYGIMGPVKAALESTVRYLAAELGPQGIRVNAVSPGPIATRAASGLRQFDQLMTDAIARAPMRRLVGIDEVGTLCAFLASDGARSITGDTLYIDGGHHIVN